MAPILWHAVSLADCDFNRAALHPADPIKCHMSHVENADTRKASISLANELPPLTHQRTQSRWKAAIR